MSPTYNLLLSGYSTKLSPSGGLCCGVDELIDPLMPLDSLHRSNSSSAQLPEAEVHAKDSQYTFSTSMREKLDEFSTTLAVIIFCMLLHQISVKFSNCPIYHEASFSFLLNLITAFIGDTFKITKFPVENDLSFLLGST